MKWQACSHLSLFQNVQIDCDRFHTNLSSNLLVLNEIPQSCGCTVRCIACVNICQMYLSEWVHRTCTSNAITKIRLPPNNYCHAQNVHIGWKQIKMYMKLLIENSFKHKNEPGYGEVAGGLGLKTEVNVSRVYVSFKERRMLHLSSFTLFEEYTSISLKNSKHSGTAQRMKKNQLRLSGLAYFSKVKNKNTQNVLIAPIRICFLIYFNRLSSVWIRFWHVFFYP